jgi:hypothetical protein
LQAEQIVACLQYGIANAIAKRMRPRAAAIAATTAAIFVFSDPVHFPTATAESLNVQEVRTIEAPRVFHPPTEDTTGYWQDFGITTAFDFSKRSHLLVAIVKDAAGPTRLFTFELEQATINRSSPDHAWRRLAPCPGR